VPPAGRSQRRLGAGRGVRLGALVLALIAGALPVGGEDLVPGPDPVLVASVVEAPAPDGDVPGAAPDEGPAAGGSDAPDAPPAGEAAGSLAVVLEDVPALLEPGHPTGTVVHEVVVRVRPAASGAPPVRAVLCLVRPPTDTGDATETDDAGCAGAVEDPRVGLRATWDAADGEVIVDGGPDHQDAGSEVLVTDDGWTVHFRFTVGATLPAGDGWRASVTVEDAEGATALARADDLEVAWFRIRLAPREDASHGRVESGGTTSGVATHGGTFLTNGPALFVVRATPFTHGTDVLTLAGGTSDEAPAWRTVGLDCALNDGPAVAIGEPTFVRVGISWTPVGLVLLARTDEPVALSTRCRLRYGGGAVHVGAPYANRVDVDLVPAIP
jgi:hypothetical protein